MSDTEIRMMRVREVSSRTGLAVKTIRNMGTSGTFPRPVKIGPKAVAWPSNIIDAWVAEKCRVQEGMQERAI